MMGSPVRTGLVALLLACGSGAASVSAETPQFTPFTAETLRDGVKVMPRRSYAAFGFNNPAVTVSLPPVSNSIYATFTFDAPKVTDAHGRAVAFEVEGGVFDFDTWSNEIRLKKKSGDGVVDFARVAGKVKIKYPLVVKTTLVKKGQGTDVKFAGNAVSYQTSLELPEAAAFSKVEPLRAYDAAGKELERSGSMSSSMDEDEVAWSTVEFKGTVASVQWDRVETWAQLTVDYDLPPAQKWPESQQGLVPSAEQLAKAAETPGGRVTKTLGTK
jgi:hypothetical protein